MIVVNQTDTPGIFKGVFRFFWRGIVDFWDAILVVTLSIVKTFLHYELTNAALTYLNICLAAAICAVLIRRVYPAVSNNFHYIRARLGWRASRAPRRYIRALFNEYAEEFDDHLLTGLSYNAPNLLRGIVGQRDQGTAPVVLDLGCGTGICGPLFAPFASELIGVDLSVEMLDHARRKGCYDQLIEADIIDFLKLYEDKFDICLAADVLVYFGDLRETFATLRRALVDGGLFAFTVEAADCDNWDLKKTGRYAHSKKYLERIAQWAGFEIVETNYEMLRMHEDAPVAGHVWLLRKPGRGGPG